MVDPSEPGNATWPPDPETLYYSPYSPSKGFLERDSAQGEGWQWKDDRWYADMRGDVDQEGWEYAFYWNGSIGGLVPGIGMGSLSGIVRGRRWVHDMERKVYRKWTH